MDAEQYDTYSTRLKQIAQHALIKDDKDIKLEEWVALSVLKNAITFGEHLHAKHIDNYDWFEVEKVEFLRDRLLKHIGKTKGSFEAVTSNIKIDEKFLLCGRMDYLEKRKIVWEFKLGALKDEHRVQVIIYLVQTNLDKGYLYSILHDIVEEITMTFEQRVRVYNYLKVTNQLDTKKSAAQLIEEFYEEEQTNTTGIEPGVQPAITDTSDEYDHPDDCFDYTKVDVSAVLKLI
jgi:hypothetical protein